MLKGGVIMDVINVEQAKIAEAAGLSHSRILKKLVFFNWIIKISWSTRKMQMNKYVHNTYISNNFIGAVAVMALERIPADIRADGGVARMSDPEMIKEIQAAVTIPVMAKVKFFFSYLTVHEKSASWKVSSLILIVSCIAVVFLINGDWILNLLKR